MTQHKDQTTLVTGAAGFIGFHLCKKLLQQGRFVIGVDNLSSYYDVSLKKARVDLLKPYKKFTFYKKDIQDLSGLKEIFKDHRIGIICNLAAQAGVRHSFKDPIFLRR